MASTASDVEFLKNFASGKLLSAKNYIEMTLQKLIFDNFIFSERLQKNFEVSPKIFFRVF